MAVGSSGPGAREFFAEADAFALIWIDRRWTAEVRAFEAAIERDLRVGDDGYPIIHKGSTSAWGYLGKVLGQTARRADQSPEVRKWHLSFLDALVESLELDSIKTIKRGLIRAGSSSPRSPAKLGRDAVYAAVFLKSEGWPERLFWEAHGVGREPWPRERDRIGKAVVELVAPTVEGGRAATLTESRLFKILLRRFTDPPSDFSHVRRSLDEVSGSRLSALVLDLPTSDGRFLRLKKQRPNSRTIQASLVVGGHESLATDDRQSFDASLRQRRVTSHGETNGFIRCTPVPGPVPRWSLPNTGPLLGRDAEVQSISETVCRLGRVVIQGLRGVGKSSVAIEVAHGLAERYPGGCYWVNAESRPRDALVKLFTDLLALAPSEASRRALGTQPDEHLEQRIASALLGLGDARALLVLDNVDSFEWSRFVRILPTNVDVLATTNRAVDLPGEYVTLECLPEDIACDLADEIAGDPDEAGAQARSRLVVGRFGCHTLSIRIAAELARVPGGRPRWVEWERELPMLVLEGEAVTEGERAAPDGVDHPSSRAVRGLILHAIDSLGAFPEAHRLLHATALFSADGPPASWAGRIAGLNGPRFERAARRLASVGAPHTADTGRIWIHRMVRDEVRRRLWSDAGGSDFIARAGSELWSELGPKAFEDPFAALGVHDEHLEPALALVRLGTPSIDWLRVAERYVALLVEQGRNEPARALATWGRDQAERMPGPDLQARFVHHLGVLEFNDQRYESAAILFERSKRTVEAVPTAITVAEMCDWGLDHAEALLFRGADRGNRSIIAEIDQILDLLGSVEAADEVRARAHNLKGFALMRGGRPAESGPCYEEAVRAFQHPTLGNRRMALARSDVAMLRQRQAGALRQAGDLPGAAQALHEAVELLTSALADLVARYGTDHPTCLVRRRLLGGRQANLADALRALGSTGADSMFAAGLDNVTAALDAARVWYPDRSDARLLAYFVAPAALLARQDALNRSEELLREALDRVIHADQLSPQPLEFFINVWNDVIDCYLKRGTADGVEGARRMTRDLLEVKGRVLSKYGGAQPYAWESFARTHRFAQEEAEAELCLERARALRAAQAAQDASSPAVAEVA